MEGIIIEIPAKPYVRKYLINNFGNPVNLISDKYLHKYFLHLLQRKTLRNNLRYSFSKYGKKTYTKKLEFVISLDAAPRYGYFLPVDVVIDWNNFIEDYVKKEARLFIAALQSCNIRFTDAIRDFQETFKYNEEDFSFEAIKKDFQRHGKNTAKKIGMNVPKIGINVL